MGRGELSTSGPTPTFSLCVHKPNTEAFCLMGLSGLNGVDTMLSLGCVV